MCQETNCVSNTYFFLNLQTASSSTTVEKQSDGKESQVHSHGIKSALMTLRAFQSSKMSAGLNWHNRSQNLSNRQNQ